MKTKKPDDLPAYQPQTAWIPIFQTTFQFAGPCQFDSAIRLPARARTCRQLTIHLLFTPMTTATTPRFRARHLRALLTLEASLAANARQFVLFSVVSLLVLVGGGLVAAYLPQQPEAGLGLLTAGLGGTLINWVRYQFRQEMLLTEVQFLAA